MLLLQLLNYYFDESYHSRCWILFWGLQQIAFVLFLDRGEYGVASKAFAIPHSKKIETVDIDLDNGAEEYKAKYVVLKVTFEEGASKYIVRARKKAAYHRDVSDPVSRDLVEVWGAL